MYQVLEDMNSTDRTRCFSSINHLVFLPRCSSCIKTTLFLASVGKNDASRTTRSNEMHRNVFADVSWRGFGCLQWLVGILINVEGFVEHFECTARGICLCNFSYATIYQLFDLYYASLRLFGLLSHSACPCWLRSWLECIIWARLTGGVPGLTGRRIYFLLPIKDKSHNRHTCSLWPLFLTCGLVPTGESQLCWWSI